MHGQYLWPVLAAVAAGRQHCCFTLDACASRVRPLALKIHTSCTRAHTHAHTCTHGRARAHTHTHGQPGARKSSAVSDRARPTTPAPTAASPPPSTTTTQTPIQVRRASPSLAPAPVFATLAPPETGWCGRGEGEREGGGGALQALFSEWVWLTRKDWRGRLGWLTRMTETEGLLG